MSAMNRRDFLRESAAFAAAWAAATAAQPVPAAEPVGSANERLRVAVLGVNGRGLAHIDGFAGKHNCEVAIICDPDQAVIGRAMKAVEKAQGKPATYVQDLRRVMDDKSIDIVAIATPNHWHALAAIWAMQAGKDVYVEKPVSHNVSEGRRIVEVARTYNRICQTGTQSRSMPGMQQAIAFVQSGKIGPVRLARGLCYKPRKSIGKVSGEQPIPKSIDYDLWCGPAPVRPLMRQRLHYDWHWIWDYGNGDLGNQGSHEMDKARWGLGKRELPKVAFSIGGRFGYVDDGETANTQVCVFDYDDARIIFEVRGLDTKDLLGAKVGNIFYGTEGYVVCPSYSSGVAFNNKGEVIEKFAGTGDHFRNFVQAVRSRKASELTCDILEGHLSAAMCHLANISYRLGTLEPFNRKSHTFGDDKELAETLARTEEHLRENRVPLDGTSYRLGRKLLIDPKTETIVNDTEANLMLTREYRKGFEVPEKV
ncbi:MAG: Gfo/Idh/MocA family oxidoreductase [Gemmataceae bacterium]|nr:Gfo/Idh/MocA family oxidoreductase [Gemmataceae bacterium]MDW8266250.1 Gfo/Idh/MocA family oxidoreductase [Gemmataceae bacterium]